MASKMTSLKRKEIKNPHKVQKVSKKQQIDSFVDDDEDEDVEFAEATVRSTNAKTKTKQKKVAKTGSKANKQNGTAAANGQDNAVDENDSNEDNDEFADGEVDDQTAALLKGFESSDDEGEQEGAEDLDKSGLSAAQRRAIAKIPTSVALEEQLREAQRKSGSEGKAGRSGAGTGVIYVGRIPHGFYEREMRGYFSQFGDITRLRVSRNRKTGAVKHYGFIEFASAEVARIVAKTMDNYLMFGHILKVKLLAPEQVHPELFKGANRRFKRVPWNKLERFRLANTDRAGWAKRIESEAKRRNKKLERLRDLGYDFEMPELRQVEAVPVQQQQIEAAETGIEEEVQTAKNA